MAEDESDTQAEVLIPGRGHVLLDLFLIVYITVFFFFFF